MADEPTTKPTAESADVEEKKSDDDESDYEEVVEEVIDDPVPLPEMPPVTDGRIEEEPTDEMLETISKLKQAAMDAEEAGNLTLAVEKLTEAFQVGGPLSAMMLCRRANLLMKEKRPNAVVADCTRALEVNPDSGRAFKLRGKAYRDLKKWELASKDLNNGLQIDFDEDTFEVQKEVGVEWQKIAHAKRRRELKAEKIEEQKRKEKIERIRAARAEAAAAEEKRREEEQKKMGEDMNFDFGSGDGANPLGAMFANMLNPVLEDPEIKELMKNPKVAEYFF